MVDMGQGATTMSRWGVMAEVEREMERQDTKWGVQNHGPHHWNTIITEELGESAEAIFAVESLQNFAAAKHYATELVHVAACAIQAVETLRRLHPEYDPENEMADSQKAIPARAKTKGEIVLQAHAMGDHDGDFRHPTCPFCQDRVQ